MRSPRTIFTLMAVATLTIASSSAQALPITYNFLSGSMTVTATLNGSPLPLSDSTFDLDGNFVTFDEGPPADIPDFEFSASNQGPLTLGTSVGGYELVTIDSLLIEPGTGYGLITSGGSNPYSVAVGPVSVSGLFTVADAEMSLPMLGGIAFGTENPSLTATVTLSGSGDMQTLALSGLTLGQTNLNGNEITYKADILFTGVVPEPSTALLVGLGLTGLAAARRRRAN